MALRRCPHDMHHRRTLLPSRVDDSYRQTGGYSWRQQSCYGEAVAGNGWVDY